jgi:hypothetical protein
MGLGLLVATRTAKIVAVLRPLPAIGTSASDTGGGLLRESFKPRADVVELIHLVQNRFKAMGKPLAENLRCGKLQMDWLRSEDLKRQRS